MESIELELSSYLQKNYALASVTSYNPNSRLCYDLPRKTKNLYFTLQAQDGNAILRVCYLGDEGTMVRPNR